MLQNAYFLAKIGADTAENERKFAENLPKIGWWQLASGRRPRTPARSLRTRASRRRARASRGARTRARRGPRTRRRGAKAANLAKLTKFAEFFFQLFGRLVLGCIKTKFCKKICVWQHFSSSTRFASFCTAAISKCSQKICLKFQHFFRKMWF